VPCSGGAVPCGDVLCLAVECYTLRWGAVPFSGGVLPNGEVFYLVVTVRYLVVQVLTLWWSAVPCGDMRYLVVTCGVLCLVVRCCALRWIAVPYGGGATPCGGRAVPCGGGACCTWRRSARAQGTQLLSHPCRLGLGVHTFVSSAGPGQRVRTPWARAPG